MLYDEDNRDIEEEMYLNDIAEEQYQLFDNPEDEDYDQDNDEMDDEDDLDMDINSMNNPDNVNGFFKEKVVDAPLSKVRVESDGIDPINDDEEY